MGKCIIFSAPSGSGKTTIVKQLLIKDELKLEFSISATSRQPRNGEVNGKDYYFLSADEFRKKIEENAFVEFEEVYTDSYYGTLKSELQRIWDKGNHVAFDVDVVGGLNLRKQFGADALAIFVQPPSLEELKIRLINRGTETPESLKKRLDKAEYELSFAPQFDVCIVNDVLEVSVKDAYNEILKFIK